MNVNKKKFLITFVSIFLTIFFINPFLSFYTEKNDIYGLRYKAAKKANLFYDKRNRLEVIKDLKKENQEAFPVIPPTGFYKRFKNMHLKIINFFLYFFLIQLNNNILSASDKSRIALISTHDIVIIPTLLFFFS